MAAEIFTDDWAGLWAASINDNADYRKAAANWEGAIGLIMTADPEMGVPEERMVVADLWHGECRSATAASKAQMDEAPYLISAPPEVWKTVLGGTTDPIVGLMGGKLKLTRGSLFGLLPYARAAKELVRSATQVDTRYPEGWT